MLVPFKLPNAESANVQQEKITAYLLNSKHPLGQYKSAFFEGLGYTLANWVQFADDLKQHARENFVISMGEIIVDGEYFGDTYAVVGPLKGPNGREAIVKSVWSILANSMEYVPVLTTAYPAKHSDRQLLDISVTNYYAELLTVEVF